MKTIAQQLKVKQFPFEIKDEKGNRIYFENSTNYWIKSEFDENNNEIYHENSTNFWNKSEFNKNNNQMYYENSNGLIIDNKPKTKN